MRLEGKLAIITGGASGIGRAGAELFSEEGAAVVIVDVDEPRIEELVRSITSRGGRAWGIKADLSDASAAKSFVGEAAEKMGGLDILWNNAGTPGPAGIEDIDIEAYRKAIAINLDAGLLATGEAVAHLRRRGGGSIIFTSSVSGIVGSMYSPTYSAAKFAVVGLAKSLAQRYASDNVRVNAICPGPIETPMLPGFFARSDSQVEMEENQRRALTAVPLNRFGQPREIAHAGLWLASDDSSYVTGIALPVDGGYTCK